jgi:hypothetical protein
MFNLLTREFLDIIYTVYVPEFYVSGVTQYTDSYFLDQRLSNCGASPGRAPLLIWVTGASLFMRDIFISNEIWMQGKIYILINTFLGSHILLIAQ